MRTFTVRAALAALFLFGTGAVGCTNENGAGGTSDGNSSEAYELGKEEHNAPPMDSVDTSTPDTSGAGTDSPGGE